MSTYRIIVRPVGSGPPPEIRLRHMLKIALRHCGLKCVEMVEQLPEIPPGPPLLSDQIRKEGNHE